MPFCNKYPECKKIVCEQSKNALTPLCVAYSQELKMRKEQQVCVCVCVCVCVYTYIHTYIHTYIRNAKR